MKVTINDFHVAKNGSKRHLWNDTVKCHYLKRSGGGIQATKAHEHIPVCSVCQKKIDGTSVAPKSKKTEATLPKGTVYPYHKGGGWYVLSDGSKARGKDNARIAEAKLSKKGAIEAVVAAKVPAPKASKPTAKAPKATTKKAAKEPVKVVKFNKAPETKQPEKPSAGHEVAAFVAKAESKKPAPVKRAAKVPRAKAIKKG